MADDSMLRFAEAEVSRLQEELEKTPAYKRLQAALALIAVYREDAGAPVRSETFAAREPAPSARTQGSYATGVTVVDSRSMTKTAQVEAAVTEYLVHKGRRATSGELLPVAIAKGIAITGKVPSKTMASYLSTSKRFDNVPGFGGYGLVEWNGRRGPPAMGTAGGPANDPERSAIQTSGQLPLNS
jgi:hypothetical protein